MMIRFSIAQKTAEARICPHVGISRRLVRMVGVPTGTLDAIFQQEGNTD